jgi:tetratricopeptide (TPR) repeat protein
MPFGSEFGKELTHTLVATAICCTTATVAMPAGIGVIGVVEAVLGAATIGHLLWRRRASKADALLRRCTAEIETGSDALLATEYRDDPDAPARRDAAVAAIREVLPRIVPQPAELVAARLTNDRVVAFYLDRAAQARPAVFGAMAQDDMPRRLLRDVVDGAWKLVLRQPEFRDDVAFDILRELLTGQDELRAEAGQAKQEILGAVAATPAETLRLLMAELDARGLTGKAEAAGLERQAMIRIAGRLRPDERLNFDQAVVEVEHAVGIALEVIARGERGGNQDAFVETVLRRLAETTRAGEFDRGSRDVDDALRDLARREAEQRDAMRRSRTALLEAGIEQDTLRRDAAAVARRIEALVAAEQPPGERPAWTPSFRQRWDALYDEGRDKGINFSLEIAAALARHMLDTARDSDERGAAGNLLGNALWTLGARESGTARLEQAVAAFRAALEEYARERVKLNWAATQNNLGNALQTLGERESGTARLEQAVAAYRAALEEYTRERVPLDWATTQNNLGNALATLGERESGTARLEQAVAAYRAALEERTRERVPLDWAYSQHTLANALAALATRLRDPVRMVEALDCMRDAAEVYRDGGNTYWLPIAERRIGEIDAQLAALRS